MKLSCGVVLLNELNELLVGHVTEAKQWDIPKGQADPGEPVRLAALRELQEEFGIVLTPSDLTDLGETDYLPDKRLHLFLARRTKSEVSLTSLACTSFFVSKVSHRTLPEIDDYRWVQWGNLEDFCSQKLLRALHNKTEAIFSAH